MPVSSIGRGLADLVRGRVYRAIRFRVEEKLFQPKHHSISEQIQAVVQWLLTAQRATPDGGVAESYSVLNNAWNPSYPETTGYIICSLLRAARSGHAPSAPLEEAVARMGDWLTSVQLPEGGFPGGHVGRRETAPVAFNTGQILKGLTDLMSLRNGREAAYRASAQRAVRWLVAAQDRDGCWRRGRSPLTSAPFHVYNVRTAWALARYGRRAGDEEAVACGMKNGDWACSVQDPQTAWFEHMNFDLGEPPLTHTIAYTIQGLLELGVLADNADYVERAVRAAHAVFALQDPGSGAIPGQIVAPWRPATDATSLTGNAQMAVIAYRLARVTGEECWRRKARKALSFCRGMQEMGHRNPGRRGALRGSYPGHKGYGRYWYMNWTQKFYLDALLSEVGVDAV